MEPMFLVNIVWNTGLVAVAGYMVKRWMDKVDSQLKDNCNDQEKETDKLYNKLEGIYGQLKVANSRTSKNEEMIHVQAALCAERTKQGMVSCKIHETEE